MRPHAPSSLVRAASALAAAALLAACAGEEATAMRSGGVTVREVQNVPRDVEWRGGAADAPPTLATFPEETRAFMKEALHRLSADDPAWPADRDRWVAMGPRETRFLVQLLWGAVLAGQKRNAPELVERSRNELAFLGEPAVPFLAAVLSTGEFGTAYDPASGEEARVSVDDFQRREAAAALALIGAPALPAVLGALENAETKSGRRHAILCLGDMGERGGADAAAALSRWSSSDDLVLAVEAVVGMRNHRDGVTRDALRAALRSAEPLLREKAAGAFVVRGDATVVPDLRDAAARARAEGKLVEAQLMDRCATSLTRRAGNE